MKKAFFHALLAVSLLAVLPAVAQDDAKPDETPVDDGFSSDIDRFSYMIGHQMGSSVMELDLGLNLDVLISALREAAEGGESKLDPMAMRGLQEKMRSLLMEKMQEKTAKAKAEAEAFLAENGKKDGVMTLPSGLQYKVITEGDGPSPSANDKVTVNYRGTFLDGKEFDSSYKRGEPATFPVTGVIKGWTEALQLMKKGAKWQLWIPSDLAYGERGNKGIPGGSTLVFEVELLDIAAAPEGAGVVLPNS